MFKNINNDLPVVTMNSMFSYWHEIHAYKTMGANQLHLQHFPTNIHLTDMVLLAWWILWSKGWSWYGTVHYDSNVYLLLHFKLCRDSISIIKILPCELTFFISSHYYCEVASLQWVIYSKQNSAWICFTAICEYHTSQARLVLIFQKSWSDNRNHILKVYVLTMVYDCTR